MFETMADRAGRLARRRAEERRSELAQELAAELRDGVRVEETEQGVRLSGRAIGRRFALEPRLRWLLAGRGR
ncbi:MAG TPA: hypothetical protein VN231_04440 [Allosphingosinicella sp.]|nr:hypothetical protein [Allosphingosinicella sp.]